MKAPPRDRSNAFRRNLASPRLLAELFRGLVVAAVPVGMLGVAGMACGSAFEPQRCEAQSYLQPHSYVCSEAPREQMAPGAPGEASGEAAAADAPKKQMVAASCEERCAASSERHRPFQADCSSGGEGCCTVREEPDGRCHAECLVMVHQACGRKPSGLIGARRANKNRNTNRVSPERVVGGYLAGAAELEAASVTAFEFLADELQAHGAPASLIAAAQKSGRDERRHTRSMSALAKRFGGEVLAPRVRPRRPRSLRAMAVENAVEGCVREAFGALVATYQAAHAGNPSVRRAMRGIAADETSHAALAFRVAGWLDGRLDARAARSVRASMRKAGQALLREASAPVHPALIRELGVPRPEAALQMAQGLLETLERGVVHLDLLP